MDPVATVTVVAHAGHWFMSLIYVAPVLAVIGFIVRQNRQDRRMQRTGPGDDDGLPQEPVATPVQQRS